MVAIQPLIAEFTLVGKVEDFIVDSKGRIKYLALSTPEADYVIAIAKEQTRTLHQYLQPGCHVKVTGMRKNQLHQGKISYKAYHLQLLAEPVVAPDVIGKPRRRAKMLVCQGSSCAKKGSKIISQLLQTELVAKGMAGDVEIKLTGCMKQCKQAPCLVMPGKNSYRRVQTKQVSGLIEANLTSLRRSSE